jgi:hypothetical protein
MSLLAPYRGGDTGLPSFDFGLDREAATGSPDVTGTRRSIPPKGSSSWEAVARQMAAQRGWTGADWRALDAIATAESGWNPRAVNKSSGAAGIPQMLPSAHPDINVQQFLNNPRQQIRWMLNYIGGKYGDPSSALAFRQQHNWY